MALVLNRKRQRTPIGLDIGSTGVRAAQLRDTGGGYAVSGAALRESSAVQTNGDGPTSRQIRECVGHGSFNGRGVVTGLNPPDVEFYAMELPAAVVADTTSDLAPLVNVEIARLRNEAPETLETGHWRLPPTQIPGPNALGVAARAETVTDLLETCKDAGLACLSADTGATALCRFGSHLRAWEEHDVWGVLDIGHRQSLLALCMDDVPVLVRPMNTGGQRWTERITEALQVSPGAAEIHKRDHGISLRTGGRRDGDPPARRSDSATNEIAAILAGALRTELTQLASDIKRSYEYVLSCYPRHRAADLVLVGGASALGNLPEFLGEALGIQVRRATEYLKHDGCRIQYASDKQHRLEQLALAIGLALGY